MPLVEDAGSYALPDRSSSSSAAAASLRAGIPVTFSNQTDEAVTLRESGSGGPLTFVDTGANLGPAAAFDAPAADPLVIAAGETAELMIRLAGADDSTIAYDVDVTLHFAGSAPPIEFKITGTIVTAPFVF